MVSIQDQVGLEQSLTGRILQHGTDSDNCSDGCQDLARRGSDTIHKYILKYAQPLLSEYQSPVRTVADVKMPILHGKSEWHTRNIILCIAYRTELMFLINQ